MVVLVDVMAAGSLEDEARALVVRLGGRWTERKGGLCRCPAHADRTPSLSVRTGQTRLLLHCFAGCTPRAVLRALVDGQHLAPDAPAADTIEDRGSAPASTTIAAKRVWRAARSIKGTLAERYLAARGLAYCSAELRYHPRAPFGPFPQTAFAPALVAAVRDDDGLVAIHRTRLDGAARGNSARSLRKAALGPLGSGTVRLGGTSPRLGLAEGIENALAATLLTGIPCWATLGAARFGRIALPPETTELVLFLDNDGGGREAERRARRAFGDRLDLQVRYPALAGADWNDVLLAQAARS